MQKPPHLIWRRPSWRPVGIFLVALGFYTSVRADLTVPSYNSRPGAAYTVYLDFGGFAFTGTWSTNTPGTTPAFGDATTSFSSTQLADIQQIWSSVAATYAPFNINVTTVDPAVAAGKADSDSDRQAYYDSQADMMHTVIGGTGAWNGASSEIGISFVDSTPESLPGFNGAHTNWVFSDHTGTTLQTVADTADHENGHGLGLSHLAAQGLGTSSAGSVSAIMSATVTLNQSPDRFLFGVGRSTGGNIQNDDEIIANDSNMGGFINDGIGHTLAAATPIPTTGSTIDFSAAKGVIVPASSSNPAASGSASYQPDFWSFTTTGGLVSLIANSGEEFVTPGTPDPGATLNALLSIYNSTSTLLAVSPTTDLSESISTTLAAGTYYAEVTGVGDAVDVPSNTDFFDQGPYFLSGTIPVPEPLSAGMALIALIPLFPRRAQKGVKGKKM